LRLCFGCWDRLNKFTLLVVVVDNSTVVCACGLIDRVERCEVVKV